MPRVRSRRPISAAFSMMEIVVVMLLMAILAAVAAPRMMGALQRQRAQAAATRIAGDLEFARRQARARSAMETVSFDARRHRYTLSEAQDLDHPAQPYSVDLSASPYCTELVSVDFAGSASVTFNAFGIPDRGGKIVVASGPFRKTIELLPNSGCCEIQP